MLLSHAEATLWIAKSSNALTPPWRRETGLRPHDLDNGLTPTIDEFIEHQLDGQGGWKPHKILDLYVVLPTPSFSPVSLF